MNRDRNKVGKKFGKLLVIEKLSRKYHGEFYYKCQCDCGNICEVLGQNIGRGTNSCGCLKINKIGYSAMYSAYSQYIANAKKRNLEFTLTLDEFKEITSKNCYYCNTSPSNESRGKEKNHKYNGSYVYNGIDRVDNTRGYFKDSCVPCCKQCNSAKRKLSKEEYLNWIKNVYEYQFFNSKGT